MFVVFILSFTRTIVTDNRICALNHDKELPRQIRRNMKGSESEEIFKEKSSNKRPDRKYHRTSKSEKKRKEKKIRKMGCCREMSSYVYFLIERTRNKILIRKFHDFRIFHSIIRIFPSIICNSMQFWIGDAI